MFTVDAGPMIRLTDPEAGSSATLAPARGGMITSFVAAGRELLYLDQRTFEDPTANVRGGVPVLFPSPGKLTGDAWAWGGARGSMKQHGFARNLPWEVIATSAEGGASATIVLRSSEVTRAQYPFDFEARYHYRLSGRALRIEMRIENTGASPMPFGVGFHPYFAVREADKASARIPTGATRAFDNKAKREVALGPIDLTAEEVDLHLLDHGATTATLADVTVRGSKEMTHWVIWTLRGKDFVCLEPWSCPGDALNTGDRLMVLPPGGVAEPWIEIEG